MGMRLDRMLSGQGVCTRRELRQMVRDGRVLLNGRPAASADCKVEPGTDTVEVDGCPVVYSEHVYYMMNKPQGVVSASRDPKARTVLDLLPPELVRPGLFPAGRLDRDTEGLLIITDDGAFAHRMLAPKSHVPKKYFARTDLPVSPEDIRRFHEGIVLADGTSCLPAGLAVLPGDGTEAVATVCEGKFHQVKRMFAAVGKQVLFLRRVSVGGLALDAALKAGETRALTPAERELVCRR